MANFKLFHNNPNNETLKDFADSYKIRLNDKFSLDDFFSLNKEIIFKQLSQSQLIELAKSKGCGVKDLSADDIDKDIILPCPCHLFIDDKYVDYSLAVKNTNFQSQNIDFIAFADEQIKNVLSEVNVYFLKHRGDIERMKPGCRVLGWFKSLYYSGKGSGNHEVNNIYNSSANFVDISAFITQMNVSVSNSGGNFTITLPHIPVYSDIILSDMSPTRLFSANINSGNFVNKEQMNNFYLTGNSEELVAKAEFGAFNYFEWLIQHNDLLFISFHDMEDLEDDNLSGHQFDMIALVDNVTVNKNSPSANISVTVSGRDLMKLITDDASIFFPTGVAASNGRIFDNTETTIKGGDLESVMRYKGVEKQDGTPRQLTHLLNIFAQEPNDFSIDFVIKTVVSHLSNMQIVPDDLFVSWGDKRTMFSELKPKDEQ